jgi:hypothetical protein
VTEIVPGITLIALVSDAPGTKELKELSLAIRRLARREDPFGVLQARNLRSNHSQF